MMIDINEKIPICDGALELPRYGLGAAHISEAPAVTAIATVQTAYQNGIRFFDTAPLYGKGQSERFLGEALSGVARDSFLLVTKVGHSVDLNGNCAVDFSHDGILRSLEQSLQRLGMDYVDILHIHDPDDYYEQALNEAFPVLAELRGHGVIKAIGVGMNQWQMLSNFAKHADFDCFLLAGRYTLLEQTSLHFLKLCQEKSIAVILGGIYNSGILASDLQPNATYEYQKAPQKLLKKARQIRAICHRYDVALNVAALQFPYLNPAVCSAVVGAQSPAEVLKNLEGLAARIPKALWDDLEMEGFIEVV